MTFNERLKAMCEDVGLQQKDLAKTLKITPSKMSYYIRGAGEPSYSLLMTIADYFGVSVDYLIGHDAEEFKHEKTLEDIKLENSLLRKENGLLKETLTQINRLSKCE